MGTFWKYLGVFWRKPVGWVVQNLGLGLWRTWRYVCRNIGDRFLEHFGVRLWKSRGVRLLAFYIRVQYYVCVCSPVALVRWIMLVTLVMLLSTFKFRSACFCFRSGHICLYCQIDKENWHYFYYIVLEILSNDPN